MALPRRLFVTGCAVTRTTETVVRLTGARFFLPAVLVQRFADFGGIDPDVMAGQFKHARSFADGRWVDYWSEIAAEHAAKADEALRATADAAGLTSVTVDGLIHTDNRAAIDTLGQLLAPAALLLADRGPHGSAEQVDRFVSAHASDDVAATGCLIHATIALDSLVKVATYHTIAAWPVRTTARMRAYTTSRRLAEALVTAIAPAIGVHFEAIETAVDGELVTGFAVFPSGEDGCATVLAVNGLDGTAQELLFSLLKYRNTGLGMVVMEMPGTYSYRHPMSERSERIFDAVIEHLAQHPRVDGDRIGIFGLSFGGYWSTRMAASNSRLRCAVTCGTPTHRSFQPSGSIGIPEVMVAAMRTTVGAAGLRELAPTLRALSLRDMYGRIAIPLLVINGDSDTIVDSRDSIDLAAAVPHSDLLLYAGDDHCAIGHFTEWMDLALDWLRDNLTQRPLAPGTESAGALQTPTLRP